MSSGKEIRKDVTVGIIILVVSFIFEQVRNAALKFIKWFLFEKTQIPIWFASILCLCLVICIVYILIKIRKPKWTSYTSDVFENLRWRWGYDFGNNIEDLKPYCMKDDTLVIYKYLDIHESNTMFTCETCGSKYGPHQGDINYIKSRIIRQIDRKIRNNQYLK